MFSGSTVRTTRRPKMRISAVEAPTVLKIHRHIAMFSLRLACSIVVLIALRPEIHGLVCTGHDESCKKNRGVFTEKALVWNAGCPGTEFLQQDALIDWPEKKPPHSISKHQAEEPDNDGLGGGMLRQILYKTHLEELKKATVVDWSLFVTQTGSQREEG